MNKASFLNLTQFDFHPLSWVKARLSEVMCSLRDNQKRVVITTNGRPTAVLLSYDDFLEIVSAANTDLDKTQVIDFEEWKKKRKNREKVRDSVVSLFDTSLLTRKGQKKYKEDTVRDFQR